MRRPKKDVLGQKVHVCPCIVFPVQNNAVLGRDQQKIFDRSSFDSPAWYFLIDPKMIRRILQLLGLVHSEERGHITPEAKLNSLVEGSDEQICATSQESIARWVVIVGIGNITDSPVLYPPEGLQSISIRTDLVQEDVLIKSV